MSQRKHRANAPKVIAYHQVHQNQLTLALFQRKNHSDGRGNEGPRIRKDHQGARDSIFKQKTLSNISTLTKYYEGEEKKISIIPTIDKNNPQKKFPPPSTLVPPLQHLRKHSTDNETKLQMRL